jgi:predicted metal-binding protein
MQISVCGTCPLGKTGFAEKLRLASASLPFLAEVDLVDCMSGCARESTLAFRSPGKVAYLLGDLTVADLPELLEFAKLYHASADGCFADARVLGALRTKALARIPG